jgi:hypothetical protein
MTKNSGEYMSTFVQIKETEQIKNIGQHFRHFSHIISKSGSICSLISKSGKLPSVMSREKKNQGNINITLLFQVP